VNSKVLQALGLKTMRLNLGLENKTFLIWLMNFWDWNLNNKCLKIENIGSNYMSL